MSAHHIALLCFVIPLTALDVEPLGDANMAKANKAAATLVEERWVPTAAVK